MHSTNFNKWHFHIYLKYFKESRDFFLWFMSYVEMCNWFPKYFSIFKLFQLLITSSLVSREGNGNPPQFSCLENPMGEGAWQAAVHGVMESRTRLSDFTFTPWRRKWQPTPVFLPGESPGWGAWWAAICGVAQSRTRLKRLSSSSSSSFRMWVILMNIPCELWKNVHCAVAEWTVL